MAVTQKKMIEALLKGKKYATLRDVLMTTNEADLAAVFEELPEEDLPVLFRLLPKDLAADTFALMGADEQELLIHGFSDNELKEVFDELYVDDAADIVEEMPANVVKRILANTSPDTRKIINEILQYPEDSAGSLMSVEYISLRPKMTVGEAIKRIRRTITNAETIYTCYVTDDNRHLLGYISVKSLLLADEDEIIGEIMETTPICVKTTDDKEDVAKKMGRYDFAIMPVVDEETRLVGIVMFDDAFDVIQEETTEDIERMAAINPNEESYFRTSDFIHAKNRIVWLLALMLSSIFTERILDHYESAFSAIAVLVGFIPMLMGVGGNCGSQSSTLIIRGMAIDQIKLKDFFKVVWTELRVSVAISLTLAVVNWLWIMLTYRGNPQHAMLALVISLSIMGIVVISQLIGCSLPMLAKKLRLDPAVMAAPLITTIVDVTSIFIYFNIASRFFNL